MILTLPAHTPPVGDAISLVHAKGSRHMFSLVYYPPPSFHFILAEALGYVYY